MKLTLVYSMTLFVVSTSLVFAHGSPGGGGKPQQRSANVSEPQIEDTTSHKEIHGKLIQEKTINGFDLMFKVVDVRDSVPDGGSHNFLVNIKRDDITQHNLSVSTKVAHSNGMTKSKTMMKLGDWYLAGYDLAMGESYLINVSFKSADGKIHHGEISYP